MSGPLVALGTSCAADSRRWFPDLYRRQDSEVLMHTILGLTGEAGEVANVVKKANRRGWAALEADGDALTDFHAGLADELADVVIYAVLAAHVLGLDLDTAIASKRARNESRFGGGV